MKLESLPSDFSLEVHKLNVEHQCGIGRNHAWNTLRSISVVGGASEDSFLTLLELGDAFVPSLDHLADSNNKLEGFSPVVT